jgi:hypothetical protein
MRARHPCKAPAASRMNKNKSAEIAEWETPL